MKKGKQWRRLSQRADPDRAGLGQWMRKKGGRKAMEEMRSWPKVVQSSPVL